MPKNNSTDQPRRVLNGDNGKTVFAGYELTAKDLLTVRRLGMIGCSHAEISTILGVDYETVRTWVKEPEHPFRMAWEQGTREGKVTLRRKQWHAAMQGNIVMLIWLGKQLLGQRDDPSTLVCVTGAEAVQIEGRSPREIRAELVELQEEIWREAEGKRIEDKGENGEAEASGK